ncbi:restriction endonuclease subunit S [Ligilactobacillus aviarius]|uniref:restriction endonuclease subunit S n=1 Tax=Ligilactobacillus aviarius TaxID=1606 RepID=UPI00242EF2EE|nr:restriction endonuclease subunit S [Ligilactobacillus aviarius]
MNLYGNGAVSTLYIAFKANADINSDFLENLFSSNKWHNEVYKIAAEGARNHGLLNISPDDFFNIKITISKDSQEQSFISKFLRIFDNLLALYDRKLKLLSQVKKYFLDNLFTEKEYPNLRFKGFTDAWEHRKLEEVTLFIRNGVTIKQNGSYGIPITRIESISTGTLNLSKVGYADIQTDKYKGYYLKNNDILFSNINSLEHIGKVAFVQHLSLDVIHGMNLLNIRVNEKSISSKFIYYRLLIMKYNNLFKKIAKPAVNQASIAISELKKLVIKVPAVNEQCKIQALLTCLEKIITLYESKKQNLNKIKNTLLNTMFI